MSNRIRPGLLALLGIGAAAASIAAPTASITYPTNQTLSNIYSTQGGSDDVGVTGTASAPSLRDWTLQYKPAAAPTWTLIKFSTQPVTNGLLGTWSTLDRPDGSFNVNGAYNLQLIVCDTSNVCATTTVNDTLSNFSLTQSTPSGQPELNTPAGQRVTYTAILPWALNLTLSIKNLGLTVVKAVGASASGTWTYQWDGTNTAGVRVPDGPYFVSATVTDGTNSMLWDQTQQFRGDHQDFTHAPETQFDPFNNQPLPISYNFAVGRVTIAASLQSGDIASSCPPPGGFCLVDHRYEESGLHTIQWPAVDATGRFRPDIVGLVVTTDRDTFSRNAVVLYGTKPTVSNVTVTPPVAWSGSPQTVEFDVTGPTPISTRSVSFLNQESATVLRTLTSISCVGSHCTVVWDGKATNGMLVAPGGYTITATATDTLGNIASSQGLAFIQH